MATLNLALTVKQSRANAISTALGNAALIRIYSGSIPATPETAATGTLLSTLTGNASGFAGAAVTNGVNNLTGGVGGSGMTNGSFALIFSGGGGSGAAGTAFVASGAVASYTITNPGSGYTSAPTVSLSNGGGTPPTAPTAVLGVVLTSSAITQDSSAVASGTPGYARLVAAGAAAGAAGLLDVDVSAVGGSGAMQITPATITAGAPVTCSSFLIEEA